MCAKANAIFFRSDDRRCVDTARRSQNAVEIVLIVAVVVCKGDARSQMQSVCLEPGEELIAARDSAEGNYRAGDAAALPCGASDARSGPCQFKALQLRFHLGVVCRNGENVGAMHRAERLAQIAGGQQMIVQVAAIKQSGCSDRDEAGDAESRRREDELRVPVGSVERTPPSGPLGNVARQHRPVLRMRAR